MDSSTLLQTATTEPSQLLIASPRITLSRTYYNSTKSDGNLTYQLPDADGSMHVYSTPGAYTMPLNDETLAKGLVQSVGGPQMTFNNPTRQTGATNLLARARSGWFYTNPSGNGALDNLHGAIDYYGDTSSLDGVKNPSFPVYAVAAGSVINVYWDYWSGNTVIMEHYAPNGTVYRSIYCHLRNGPANDRQTALRLTPTGDPLNSKADAAYKAYRLFAQKTATAAQEAIWWGTEDKWIRVATNSWVTRGQLLGFAGNTGPGGAGADLDATGTPNHPNWANVHLHMFFAVREPDAISVPGVPAQWMLIDPYGVYNDANTAGYTPGQPTPLPRFIVGDA